MATYRERRVTVEAVQWTGTNQSEVVALCPNAEYDSATEQMLIPLQGVDGTSPAEVGDWIVERWSGAFGVMTNDAFQVGYELAP